MLRDLEMVLNNIEIELLKGTETDSIKEPEIERDSDSESGDERGADWWASLISMEPQPQLGLSKGTVRDSSKEPAMERDEMKETFSRKHQTLVKELISAERERKDLLLSITPTFSLWKQVDSQKTWRRQPCPAARDDGEQDLADYLNSMLQAMEDVGHRMLSMLDFLNKSDSPGSICLYKASELHSTAARLDMLISKEFNTDQHPETMQVQEEEDLSFDLLSLFTKYSQFPNNYHNTLSQLVMEEYEEKKYEVAKVEEEEQDKDESTMEYLKERMDIEQQFLAYDRTYWEDVWGSRIGRCGRFMDTTILSPMQFTHYTPGGIHSPAAVAGTTLQIYSVKIKDLRGLNWPLRVYGVIAARDTVDHNRNILFSRSEFNYQELNEQDPYLCLTGPSRAIVVLGHIDFEVELQVTDGAQSQTLISCRERYGSTDAFFSSLASVTDGGDGRTFLLSNQSCTTEVTLGQLDRSLQATIMGVRVTEGPWPFKYGCRVVCSWSSAAPICSNDTTCRQVVLFDHRGKGMRRGSDGYLHLSRKVISIESYGTLRVSIESYGKSGRHIARKDSIHFPVQKCQTKTLTCPVGDGGATVEVTVAWSLLVKEKVYLSLVDCPM
ncbi:hypothetical protein CFC21_020087 [Triticum aestivum]|uniref:DUF6598 domain-containing protein n=2 Tax=Triticum aestivum TaxID=4565 RepID=A0A3B6B9N5_WHEAT|nr:uncharacterized protein LOC123191242 [Triticum aestivum]KAF7004919.1 hypothetical protein CFC21_020087 [Triticum aestivum]